MTHSPHHAGFHGIPNSIRSRTGMRGTTMSMAAIFYWEDQVMEQQRHWNTLSTSLLQHWHFTCERQSRSTTYSIYLLHGIYLLHVSGVTAAHGCLPSVSRKI
jgi:hypothetical protein